MTRAPCRSVSVGWLVQFEQVQEIVIDDPRDPHHCFQSDIDLSKFNLSKTWLCYSGRRGDFLL